MVKVRCKVFCSVAEPQGDGFKAQFYAVTNGSDENAKFFHCTPGLSLSIGTIKEQPFEVGKEYYLDIIPAEVPPVDESVESAEAVE